MLKIESSARLELVMRAFSMMLKQVKNLNSLKASLGM